MIVCSEQLVRKTEKVWCSAQLVLSKSQLPLTLF